MHSYLHSVYDKSVITHNAGGRNEILVHTGKAESLPLPSLQFGQLMMAFG